MRLVAVGRPVGLQVPMLNCAPGTHVIPLSEAFFTFRAHFCKKQNSISLRFSCFISAKITTYAFSKEIVKNYYMFLKDVMIAL